MPHIHRLKPTWVLLTSPAWNDGFHKVICHAICLDCGHTTYISAWQSPRHLNARVVEEGEA